MKNILQKISDLYNKVRSAEFLNKVTFFCKKNKRYLSAVLLFILFVIVLTQCTGKNGGNLSGTQSTEQGSETEFNINQFDLDAEFLKEENPELNTLISNYFTAYAADDLDALATIAYPMSDNEKSYIGVFSQYIESYQNIKCYYKNGLSKGSYLVSVSYDLKFYGVDTLAPGLDFFYVETKEDGGLFINNLYCSYNMGRTENELDPSIYAVILKFEQQDDIIQLQQQVETKYTEAVASDVKLATMISTTIPTAMTQWLESVENAQQSSEQDTQQSTEQTTQQTTEQTTSESQPAESTTPEQTSQEQPQTSENTGENPQENTVQQVRTTSVVYVRKGPGKENESYGKVKEGVVFTKLGTEGDWVKIDYNGSEGYIRSDFLENVTN